MSAKDTLIWLDQQVGIMGFIIPFILVFTILYAIFTKMKILKIDNNNYNLFIALAIALMVTGPAAYFGRESLGRLLEFIVPWIVLLFMIFFLWAILVGAMGMEVDKKLAMTIIGFLLFLELIIPESLIFGVSFGISTGLLPPFFYSREFIGGLLVFFAALLAVWYIVREQPEEEKEPAAKTNP